MLNGSYLRGNGLKSTFITLFIVPSLEPCDEASQKFTERKRFLFRRNSVPASKETMLKESLDVLLVLVSPGPGTQQHDTPYSLTHSRPEHLL